ncbi:MAG: PASTA domain-containing protein [Planctomycetota bacterium]|jgi:beta-lactam-binding protein with PASTA domain
MSLRELDSILGGTICVNYVRTYFYDKLEAGTYYDDKSGDVYDTTSYIQYLRDHREDEGEDNLATWDLGMGLHSAYAVGGSTAEWVDGVKAEIDELDSSDTFDVIGLAGAVFGLAAVGEDHDPDSGEHAAASSLSDLAAILAGYQLGTGGFTWYSWYTQEGLDEAVQETVYALMALSEFDRAGYLTVIRDAGVYLQSVQLATGGWKNNVVGGDEENETTGEALRGIAAVVSQPVAVPELIDLNQGDANLAIATVGLTVGTLSYEYSDTITSDLVLSQDPAGGMMAPVTSSVDLVLSSGQPVVPDVVWMSEADANLAITAVDSLRVGTVTYEYHDTVDAGRVASQNPVGGTVVPTASSVDLIVSLGQPSVPNVVGMTEAEANSAVTNFSLVIGSISHEYSGTVAEGHVISQNPAGGTVVDVGTSVDIAVSLGQPVVPHVIGETEANAVAAIEAIDSLIAATTYQYDNGIPFGIVVSQIPDGGTVVSAGTTVNIVVSLGQPTVPGVIGETEAAARVAIEAVDALTVGSVTYAYSGAFDAGLVASQDPAGGTAVPIGSSVDLVVSLGPSALVPVIAGEKKADANSAIYAVGLVAGTVDYEFHDTVAASVVISQNPTGGVEVPIGSSVDYVVSLGQPVVALVLGGNRLVEIQNNDGGWDWPLHDFDPNNASDPDTFASVATGLAQAYRQTRDPNMLAALQKAKLFLLSRSSDFVVADGALAVELDSILGGTACVDHVGINFYDKLEVGTYYDSRSGEIHDTYSYVEALRASYTGNVANYAAWELGLGLYSAYVIGANTTEWLDGVKAEIDELDGDGSYDVLGLAGATFGLAATGEDHDPQAGQHAAASSLADLITILTSYQLDTGGFTWYWWYREEGTDETIQETAYALMALNAFDRVGYLTKIWDAGNYLQSAQLASGGWRNRALTGIEYNQITGEALRGISAAYFVLGDIDKNGSVDMTDYAALGSAWLAGYGDPEWNPHCDISDPYDDTVDELDLAAFLDNWLTGVK